MRDVFLTFLRLGLTSFGGPIAHLGYFRREFIERRGWIDERLFAHIVAFCSIIPGPTSSQVGMIVGLVRAGPGGALAAWLGFTLPSAIALAVFGAFLASVDTAAAGHPLLWLEGMLGGLAAAATAVVAQAVVGMAKTQCPDRPTQTIAIAAAASALVLAGAPAWQWLPIAAGAIAGAWWCGRSAGAQSAADAELPIALPRAVPWLAGGAFAALAAAAAFIALGSATGIFVATVIRAGSLVFGGGHVVLPLLGSLVPAGLIGAREFYAGYGAAQAVPGPLFTFAAFLGMVNSSPLHGVAGAIAATSLIFGPSCLLVFALLPALGALRAIPAAAGALRGASASVVGLLGALLYSPLVLGLSTSLVRIAIALAAFAFVAVWKAAPWIAVAFAALAGAGAAELGLRA
jgi:chromate transporter